VPPKERKKKEKKEGLGTVACTCNPSYLGGRDQEDCVSKTTWANSSIVHKTLSQKNPSPKRAGGVAQGEGPEFKSPVLKKKKGRKEDGKAREGIQKCSRNSISLKLQAAGIFSPTHHGEGHSCMKPRRSPCFHEMCGHAPW
jgi:hypothetical protein